MKRSLLTAAGLSLVSGFGLCALTVAGPVTPIQFDVGPVANLLNPHFSQNWQLFAPDPISDERGVVARLRCSDGETEWFDISSASIAATQSSRFFPSRESRIISNALIERFGQDNLTKRLAENDRADLVETNDRAQRRAERVLARYAARVGSCSSSSSDPEAAQLRYVIRSLPPWSKRGDRSAFGEAKTLDSKWIPL